MSYCMFVFVFLYSRWYVCFCISLFVHLLFYISLFLCILSKAQMQLVYNNMYFVDLFPSVRAISFTKWLFSAHVHINLHQVHPHKNCDVCRWHCAQTCRLAITFCDLNISIVARILRSRSIYFSLMNTNLLLQRFRSTICR